MKIHAIPAFDDNYIWALVIADQAIIIDAGESKPVLDFLAQHKLTPAGILTTHHHHDHVGGVADLQAVFDVPTFAHQSHGIKANAVDEGDVVRLLGLEFLVYKTAGHTESHLSYVLKHEGKAHVFCGDTLFLAGCGRMFTGTIAQLFDSFCFYDELPNLLSQSDKSAMNDSADNIVFYPAHEYSLGNLKFAQVIEPDNQAITDCIKNVQNQRDHDTPSLPTTLANERKVNVFLRAVRQELGGDTLSNIIKLANDKGLPVGDEPTALQVFGWLRELKNRF